MLFINQQKTFLDFMVTFTSTWVLRYQCVDTVLCSGAVDVNLFYLYGLSFCMEDSRRSDSESASLDARRM